VAELDGAPVHIVNLKLLAPVVRRTITVAAEFHYLSAIDKLAGHPVAPFSLVNTTVVTRPFLGGFELSGSIYNLFDRNYSYPGSPDHVQASIPQDGRTARIQLTYTFTPSAELQH
jgi:iron complex outermembrane receptor protein